MKIYTSYFARAGRLPESIVPISISLWPPKDYRGAAIRTLAPTKGILTEYKASPDWDRYVKRFSAEVLNGLDPDEVLAAIARITGGRDACLLCFERDESKCHRTLVAEWLAANGAGVAGEYRS